MRSCGRTDVDVLRTLLQDIAPIPGGTMVKTANEHLAALLRDADGTPRLRLFYAITEATPVPWQNFPIEDILALTIEKPGDWGFTGWDDDVQHLLAAEMHHGAVSPVIANPARRALANRRDRPRSV